MNQAQPGWFALGQYVGTLIEANGGQRECERATHIPQPTISRRVAGRTPFSIAELDLIATWLGTTTSALIEQARVNRAA